MNYFIYYKDGEALIPFYNWVLENYELTTNKEDVIKLKDMYEEYKKTVNAWARVCKHF